MPACGSTNKESPDDAVVVGVGAAVGVGAPAVVRATAVVLVGPLEGVDVVLLAVGLFGVAAVPRGVAGVEQPASETATPITTVSMQVAGQTLDPRGRGPRGRPTARPFISMSRVSGTPDQLASWTTVASPTPA